MRNLSSVSLAIQRNFFLGHGKVFLLGFNEIMEIKLIAYIIKYKD